MEAGLRSLPILETEQLLLRKISTDDVDDVFHYCSNANVSRYVTWDTHTSKAESAEFIQFIRNEYEQNEKALWGMELKETGQVIGTIDYVMMNKTHKKGELGYVLAEEHWGKGIMTEAAQKVIEFGFHNLGLERIQAKCFVENVGSSRVMEKAGMTYEGTMRNAMYVKGRFFDVKMYSILREEWTPATCKRARDPL